MVTQDLKHVTVQMLVEFALGALIAAQNSGFSQFSNPALIANVKEREIEFPFFQCLLIGLFKLMFTICILPPKAGLGIAILDQEQKILQ